MHTSRCNLIPKRVRNGNSMSYDDIAQTEMSVSSHLWYVAQINTYIRYEMRGIERKCGSY